jgi:hypothetical protein
MFDVAFSLGILRNLTTMTCIFFGYFEEPHDQDLAWDILFWYFKLKLKTKQIDMKNSLCIPL